MGCHFLLQCMKVKSESEVAQPCPTLSDPMDCSLPGSSVHETPNHAEIFYVCWCCFSPCSSRKDGKGLSRYYKVGVEVRVPHSASTDARDGAAPCYLWFPTKPSLIPSWLRRYGCLTMMPYVASTDTTRGELGIFTDGQWWKYNLSTTPLLTSPKWRWRGSFLLPGWG